MAGSLNKVTLIGNCGKDPEIRSTQSGAKIANFSIATSDTWTDKQSGERKERTEWHNVVCFNEGLNRVIEQYVKKGTKVYVEGRLQTRKWEDKDGITRYSTEVVMQAFGGTLLLLGGKQEGGGSRPPSDYPDEYSGAAKGGAKNGSAPAGNTQGNGPPPSQGDFTKGYDEEIPF